MVFLLADEFPAATRVQTPADAKSELELLKSVANVKHARHMALSTHPPLPGKDGFLLADEFPAATEQSERH